MLKLKTIWKKILNHPIAGMVSSRKTVKSSYGSFELETPRDRTGDFEPQLVKKIKPNSLYKSIINSFLCLRLV